MSGQTVRWFSFEIEPKPGRLEITAQLVGSIGCALRTDEAQAGAAGDGRVAAGSAGIHWMENAIMNSKFTMELAGVQQEMTYKPQAEQGVWHRNTSWMGGAVARLYILATGYLVGLLMTSAIWAAEFSGHFNGTVDNTAVQLHIQQAGDQLSGSMQAAGDIAYRLLGRVDGGNAVGTMEAENGSATLGFVLQTEGDAVIWTPALLGIPLSDSGTRFERVVAQAAPPPKSLEVPAAPDSPGVPISGFPADGRLIGRWSTGDAYASGDFSIATEYFLEFRADGTVVAGSGRVAGGSMSATFDTGEASDTQRGYWRTREKVLQVSEAAAGPWEDYAQYGFTDDLQTMMFTFGGGTKKLYSRR